MCAFITELNKASDCGEGSRTLPIYLKSLELVHFVLMHTSSNELRKIKIICNFLNNYGLSTGGIHYIRNSSSRF
jgi:hypothetical protein